MKISEKTYSSLNTIDSIIFDDYIPLKINFSTDDPKTNMYYRFGNGDTSLLEVCFNGRTGKLNNIVFVSLGECQVISKNFNIDEDKLSNALPVVDISTFVGNQESETIIDEFTPETQVKLFNNAIIIGNKFNDTDTSYLKRGDVVFAINYDRTTTHIIIFITDKKNWKRLAKFCKKG